MSLELVHNGTFVKIACYSLSSKKQFSTVFIPKKTFAKFSELRETCFSNQEENYISVQIPEYGSIFIKMTSKEFFYFLDQNFKEGK